MIPLNALSSGVVDDNFQFELTASNEKTICTVTSSSKISKDNCKDTPIFLVQGEGIASELVIVNNDDIWKKFEDDIDANDNIEKLAFEFKLAVKSSVTGFTTT